MTVLRTKAARPVSLTMFADLTDVEPTTVAPTLDGEVIVEFPDAPDGTPLVDAATLGAITARLGAKDDVEETVLPLVRTAYEANKTYLDLSAPTTAQTLAHVRALTRQNQALIRLAAQMADE